MEARPVAAMKRVEGFKEDGAGVVGLGRTTVGSPRGAGGGGGDGTGGGDGDKLGLGQGETGVQGTASGRPTEYDWCSREEHELNREKTEDLYAKLRPRNAGRAPNGFRF
jgi:hypothetical protein